MKISQMAAPAVLTGLELVPLLQGTGNPAIPLFAAGNVPRGTVLALRKRFLADMASTAAGDPGAGNLRWNNADPESATEIYISDTDADAGSIAGLWASLSVGGYLYVQGKPSAERANWQKWQITARSDESGYGKLTVTLSASDGSFADNDELEVSLQQPDTTSGQVLIPIGFACSDETTAITAGSSKIKFRMPFTMLNPALHFTLNDAQTSNGSGGTFTVDVNVGGSSILSTKVTIDNGEKTSKTAATPYVMTANSIADDAEVSIDVDQIGDGTAKGLKGWLLGERAP